MIGTEGSSIDQNRMSVTFYLILLPIFVKEVLSDFVSLDEIVLTFSLVMISSSSRLTWNITYFAETLL